MLGQSNSTRYDDGGRYVSSNHVEDCWENRFRCLTVEDMMEWVVRFCEVGWRRVHGRWWFE